MTSEHAQAKYQ